LVVWQYERRSDRKRQHFLVDAPDWVSLEVAPRSRFFYQRRRLQGSGSHLGGIPQLSVGEANFPEKMQIG
jgi:hypothetical protein